ncbi:Cof-type HAD-IIB family hydrolase [Priestia filamentosa]|uniref:Cof-type HAD-IIB family hydrolase n=1 Tax=Priestia filamentosa TaxID=1402861 RepID=UPI003978C48C
MGNRKLIFFDIDGTLLDHNKELPATTKEAIKHLKEEGHVVAIATGRAPFMYKELRKELDINTYVSFNGQYVVVDGKVIHQDFLNADELKKLTELSEEKGHPLVYMDDKNMKSNHAEHLYIKESIDSLKLKDNILSYEPQFYTENPVLQTLLFCVEEQQEFYKKEIPEFSFVRWHEYSMDVLPSGSSKARGIQRVIQTLGFNTEDTYAFGDGLNDVEMLQFVGHGIAMGNAHHSVKKVAKYVTDDVDKDGILKGLRMLHLIHNNNK